MKLKELFRVGVDLFFLCCIIGLVTYITIDATNDDELVVDDKIVESVRVCSNSNEPHTAENKEFEMTELDKYVWAKDNSYRFEIS